MASILYVHMYIGTACIHANHANMKMCHIYSANPFFCSFQDTLEDLYFVLTMGHMYTFTHQFAPTQPPTDRTFTCIIVIYADLVPCFSPDTVLEEHSLLLALEC